MCVQEPEGKILTMRSKSVLNLVHISMRVNSYSIVKLGFYKLHLNEDLIWAIIIISLLFISNLVMFKLNLKGLF